MCQHLCQMGAGWNFCVPQLQSGIRSGREAYLCTFSI